MHIKLCSERMKRKDFKLKENEFRSDIGKEFLPERVVRAWGSCGWPTPGMFKARLDRASSNEVLWKGIGSGWSSIPFPANPSHGCVSSQLLQGPSRAGCQGRLSPGCRGHRCAGRCSPRRSARTCRPRRTAGAPGAARARTCRPGQGCIKSLVITQPRQELQGKVFSREGAVFTNGLIFRTTPGSLMGAQTPRCAFLHQLQCGHFRYSNPALESNHLIIWEWQPKGSRKCRLGTFYPLLLMTQMWQVFCPATLQNAAHQMALKMIRLPELFPKLLTSLRRKIWPKSK